MPVRSSPVRCPSTTAPAMVRRNSANFGFEYSRMNFDDWRSSTEMT
jgi:hypothetical protein